ncbi:hypothetical protein U6A24_19235 [Aquimarina gracilis]|uniref:Uncharacterized protein n=2 Tax=Aquimarina gracilis TaxID=874422 RepID=A0ABU6A0E3_9FLAO|nr:hypothetical protein [Aquimarina gracilis]MEB3347619.1 hypothetical protein [Aquimarina gracilis]
MGKAGKIWLICASILFFAFLTVVIQTFKPVRNVQPTDVMKIEGIVVDIKEAPGFDIAITLENDDHYYYINRGLEFNLTVEELQREILNKKTTLYSIKRWTIFTRDGNMGHVSKLMIEDKVLFNEINNDIHEQTTK